MQGLQRVAPTEAKPYHVLVYPGGTEIGLEIQRALCHLRNVRLFSAGLDVPNHAPFVFARHFLLPHIADPRWIACLNELLVRERIDYIFPAYDDVLVALALNAAQIRARIVSSPPDTCVLTRSKSQTYKALRSAVPVPDVFSASPDLCFPVFVKPDRGQGAQCSQMVNNAEHLSWLLKQRDDYIVIEYLSGDEFTIDCFTDRERGLLFCGGRRRTRTRCGISMSSQSAPVYEELFLRLAQAISERLVFHGAWFFQTKLDRQGTMKLLEVAPRIAGTSALHRVRGVNLPLLSIYEQARIPVKISPNPGAVEIDRALVNRYRHDLTYSTVYVDLDDTLICRDSVNCQLIRFLYQCVNRRIGIVLLTKHASDLAATLNRFRLHGLFDTVLHLSASQSKCDVISDRKGIFIDDSFSERESVRERCGIPTFDCGMIEMLMDDRE